MLYSTSLIYKIFSLTNKPTNQPQSAVPSLVTDSYLACLSFGTQSFITVFTKPHHLTTYQANSTHLTFSQPPRFILI